MVREAFTQADADRFHGELMERAANQLHDALASADEAAIAQSIDTFLITSFVFTPHEKDVTGPERAKQWRDYAAEQYKLVTGSELAAAAQPLAWWVQLGRETLKRQNKLDGVYANDQDVALALLGPRKRLK